MTPDIRAQLIRARIRRLQRLVELCQLEHDRPGYRGGAEARTRMRSARAVFSAELGLRRKNLAASDG